MATDCQSPPFVLLDDSRALEQAGYSRLFTDPIRVICARSIEDVPLALEAIDQAVSDGYHVAGWIAYEVAAVFEPKVRAAIRCWPEEPLIWMMVTTDCRHLSPEETENWINLRCRHRESNLLMQGDGLARPDYERPDYEWQDYERHVGIIQDYIAAGDIYQANYTFPQKGSVAGDALDLYRKLRRAQPVQYGAFIDTGAEKILSLSPELFVRRDGDRLFARPMKGTAPRHSDPQEDRKAALSLARDEKSRAENLMIVDLIRNDLGRVARAGSVAVSDLFTIESYPTLHQMTSGVEAMTKVPVKPSDLLAALFPCGSVTGAPKIRAMEIIAALEHAPRGVYCGGIGHFSPARNGGLPQWTLSVPIRTFVVDSRGACRLGIGSGIVADSDRQAEYQECLLKASFADPAAGELFFLIETMRCEAGRIALLARHLERLSASAVSFGIPCDTEDISRRVTEACPPTGLHCVRLTLDQTGTLSVTTKPFSDDSKSVREVAVAKQRLRADSPWLRHKSSQRSLYNLASKVASDANLADILFLNERGELAEGAISTLFLEMPEGLVTPPLESGALPGVLRTTLLEDKELGLIERVLYPGDIEQASAVFIGNALRGMRRVRLRAGEVCL